MFKKKKSDIVVVTTKEQLKTAINKKEPQIEIRGELAKSLKWLGKISVPKVMALIGVLGTMTVSAPVAAASLAVVSAITGQEIALIIVASGIVVNTLVGILKGYDVEMNYNGKILRLKRKE